MIRRWAPVLLLAAGGCAYYNGIYNAKAAAKRGDKQSSRGEWFNAARAYDSSAAKAETVLARHPKTRWRADALYYSARGYALSGNGNANSPECLRGLRRLDEYLSVSGQPESRRERALIAQASCMVNGSKALSADTILTPLLDSRDADVRGQAALWAGRAALFLGNAQRAESLLALVPGSGAAWEFMTAAFQSGNVVRAESLLTARAVAGDWRSEVQGHVRKLWLAGEQAAAVRIVDLYGASRAPTSERVLLRFMMSDLTAAAGDTAQARRQASEAQRLGLNRNDDSDAQARLLALRLRDFDALEDVDAAMARDSLRVRGSTILKRLADNLTIMHLLLANPDAAGASTFLAAEIARDSLRAYRLAHAMFRSIERDNPEYEIAARALLAARAMFPESTAVYEARIVQKWDSSSAAFALRGLDISRSKIRYEDGALSKAWNVIMRQWSDTLKARRAADSVAALNAVRKQ